MKAECRVDWALFWGGESKPNGFSRVHHSSKYLSHWMKVSFEFDLEGPELRSLSPSSSCRFNEALFGRPTINHALVDPLCPGNQRCLGKLNARPRVLCSECVFSGPGLAPEPTCSVP